MVQKASNSGIGERIASIFATLGYNYFSCSFISNSLGKIEKYQIFYSIKCNFIHTKGLNENEKNK